MAFKKRRMLLIPEVNPKSFVFFFERGDSGRSWSIRDYSVQNRLREYGPKDYSWTADQIHQNAEHSLDAPTESTENLGFWHEFTVQCNQGHLRISAESLQPRNEPAPQQSSAIPILELQELLHSAKGRKVQDMDRILNSPNSEDWVTWNCFKILLRQHPSEWWQLLVNAARSRNPELPLAIDDLNAPRLLLWNSVAAPAAYENQSRVRMRDSGNPRWALRAQEPSPVEGPSEIDISMDHDRFLVYVEAKLGSDISMSTSHDPQRNQIIRNIDCLLENARDRVPVFWMLLKDAKPERGYVQLMNSYRKSPAMLARELPHRDPVKLEQVARTLTILLWSDLAEQVCCPGWDDNSAAVKLEWQRRVSG